MQTIGGYGYYSRSKFRLKKEFDVKLNIWFYLTKLLWSFTPQGGHWTLHSLTQGLRLFLVPICFALDIARIVLTWVAIAIYKSVTFLLKWFFDVAKGLILQAFATVTAKFLGVFFFVGALIISYIILFETETYKNVKLFIHTILK